jgi:hypothetical protein
LSLITSKLAVRIDPWNQAFAQPKLTVSANAKGNSRVSAGRLSGAVSLSSLLPALLDDNSIYGQLLEREEGVPHESIAKCLQRTPSCSIVAFRREDSSYGQFMEKAMGRLHGRIVKRPLRSITAEETEVITLSRPQMPSGPRRSQMIYITLEFMQIPMFSELDIPGSLSKTDLISQQYMSDHG